MKIEKKKKMQVYKEGYRHLNVLGKDAPQAVADPTYAGAVKEMDETDKRIEKLLSDMAKEAEKALGKNPTKAFPDKK